ncbi:PAS domain S-box protein [Fodinicurvata sediminis]|uniref:PAS domain S-box protein n=1 Tax=Fodinicurvata sediminis TaxID=1121832 RepID=UPI0003B7307A|nr:PAS domain S-box protein [Fodinicurvata sediminis]
MESGHKFFFDQHPDPIWIYDRESLKFLDVNQAAIEKFGYSRARFLSMTIADIRPPEDVPLLQAAVAQFSDGAHEAGVWRIYTASGDLKFVDFHWRTMEFKDRRAILAAARDVTRVIELERERSELLASEEELRHRAEDVAHRFQALFESVPGNFLVLAPEDYEIVAVSDAYLKATMTQRADLVGKRLFEAFPDDPDNPDSSSTRSLEASLERVKAQGHPDIMGVQHYPIPRPESQGGGFEDRYWTPVNAPVLGADGKIAYIVHRVEDVTEVINTQGRVSLDSGMASGQKALPELEVLLRSSELKSTNIALQDEVLELRNAQRLLGMATLKLDLDRDQLSVSENFYNILGLEPDALAPGAEGLLACVHPEDRAYLQQELENLIAGRKEHLEAQLRFIRPSDDTVVHVLYVSETAQVQKASILNGILLDITRRVEAESELGQVRHLVDLAGQTARLGGWRVELKPSRLTWTPVTAEIHEVSPDFQPTYETALSFYVAEDRERMQRLFEACVLTGRPFDETLQIVTAKDRRVWLRVIGEAEMDGQGNVTALQGAVQDISEQVKERDRSEGLSRRLGDMLESMSDAFFTLDREWHFTYLNGQAERMLERNRAELLGQNVWTEFPAAVGTAFEQEYSRAFREQETVRFLEYYPPLEKWFEVNAYPSSDGLAVYFRDVTEERAQRAHLRLLETAVSRQSDILLITDAEPVDGPEGPRIVYVNEAFTRRTGYSREEVIGKTPRILQGPGTQRQELDRIRQALEKWQPVRAEVLNYTKTGEEIWLELDIVPLANEKGWYTHWVSVERDITARKKADEAIRINEERFRLLAKATNDVIWDWDLRTNEVWWNESISHQFGYDRKELEPGPESWMRRIHPEDRDRTVASLEDVIEGRSSNWVEEYRFLDARSQVHIVVDRGFVIRDEFGKAIRMLGSMEDVSERRVMEERMRHSQKLETVGQLTGGVAHDFNNLLTVILGNAEILSESLAGDDSLKALADMTASAAERGAELTNRLLAFARQQTLQPRWVNLNEVLEGIEGLLRRTLSEEIEVTIRPAENVPSVEVDPGQLEAALLNLAVNARDAMPEGGHLIVEVQKAELDESYTNTQPDVVPGSYVVLSVSDTGEGMPADTLERAFEPFYTTKDVGKGSGLGLSMVYGFMKQSGGHARIYSEVGQGTTVRLYFPQAQGAVPDENPEQAGRERPGGREHILVVEDDELVRKHLVGLLSELNYRVTDSSDAASALQILKQQEDIDLLFTDVIMPGGMNGPDLAREASDHYPDLKVLFTSGYTENTFLQDGRLESGVHLLSKPYRRQELAEKLREVLDA